MYGIDVLSENDDVVVTMCVNATIAWLMVNVVYHYSRITGVKCIACTVRLHFL